MGNSWQVWIPQVHVLSSDPIECLQSGAPAFLSNRVNDLWKLNAEAEPKVEFRSCALEGRTICRLITGGATSEIGTRESCYTSWKHLVFDFRPCRCVMACFPRSRAIRSAKQMHLSYSERLPKKKHWKLGGHQLDSAVPHGGGPEAAGWPHGHLLPD